MCLLVTARISSPESSQWPSWINSLRPSDAIWLHRSRSTLAQVMAWCLMAPSHYLNQCWLIINEVMWHSPENNFARSALEFNPYHVFRDQTFEITTTSPKSQWINRTRRCRSNYLLVVYNLMKVAKAGLKNSIGSIDRAFANALLIYNHKCSELALHGLTIDVPNLSGKIWKYICIFYDVSTQRCWS